MMNQHKLLLVVEANPTNDASHPWNKANVVTELACADAIVENDAIVTDQDLVNVRALSEDFKAADKQILANLQPGQWIEVTGRAGGPLQEYFFPASIKVRDDLPAVPAESLPKADELYDNVFGPVLGDPKPETVRFPVHAL
jgi:hypothetical protein